MSIFIELGVKTLQASFLGLLGSFL